MRLASAELGLSFELLDENPWEWRQGFLSKNPAGELPVLEYDNGLVLCGAYSILEFLAEQPAPASSPLPRPAALVPGNREERAEVRRLTDWFHGKLDREVTREILFEKVYQRMRTNNAAPPDPEILRTVRANLKYHMSYVTYLSDARQWLAGDDLSIADFAAAAHFSTLDYLGEVDWRQYPAVKAWYQRVKSRPAFRAILADRVPGTPPPVHYADLDF